MKRTYRLRRPKQFQRVRREGRTFNHPLLRLTVAQGRRRKIRCGFVVGKRIGGAVQRNRARRRVREAVRLDFDHIAYGLDLVFIVRTADVASVPFPVLQQAVRTLLKRAGAWCDINSPAQGATNREAHAPEAHNS